MTLLQNGAKTESEARPGVERDPRSSAKALDVRAKALSPRVLFLDDDPLRAEAFLDENPHAVWVKTAAECLERLTERWEEVHLDHDLGGKRLVDSNADECGMEVTRWLCREPRAHLRETLFFVHTHNLAAGLLMVLTMRDGGYKAEFRPFGTNLRRMLSRGEPHGTAEVDHSANDAESSGPRSSRRPRWLNWWSALWDLRRRIRR